MDLKLPLLGDVMTEGTLVGWLQPNGAFVVAGAPVYQLETDKVSLTVEAPASGILEQVVEAGRTVPVGTVVARLQAQAAATTDADAAPPPAADASEGGADEPDAGAIRSDGPDAGEVHAAGPDAGEVRASPAARRLARRLGVDLIALGTSRRIREADVQAYAAAHAEPAAAHAEPAASPPPPPHGVPLTGRRKLIAERLHASLQQTAQLTIAMDVDMTEALRLRAQLEQLLPEAQRPSITDLVIVATVRALREHPGVNATFVDGCLQLHQAIHIGLAVDAEAGLIVPVVRDAQQLSLKTLAEATKRLAAQARANQLTLEQLQDGTFTITSLGPHGVDFFTPIINPPQVAILGIGRLYTKLVLDNDKAVERQALYLNLSFDHQVLDGAPAARFLHSVKRGLELPASLLL